MAETALFSLTPSDLARFRSRDGAVDRAVLALHNDLRRVLLTVLFGNMAVNVLFFAVSTLQASRAATESGGGVWLEVAASLSGLLCVLLVGEVLPKNAAIVVAPAVTRVLALPILAVHRALLRPLAGFDVFARLVARAFGLRNRQGSAAASLAAEELRLLIETGRADGILSPAESDWLDRVVTLPATRLRDVMTHRLDAATVDLDAPVGYVIARARASGRARLPVRDPDRDEWVGWIDGRELAIAGADPSDAARAHLRPALWLSEMDRADQALTRLLSPESPLAFVVDERGEVSGLATQADLMAELFGHLDENYRFEPPRETDSGWTVPGATPIRAWREWLGGREDLPDCSTIGGLVTVLLGRPPRKGDAVRWRNVRLEVLSVKRHRAASVQLRIDDEPPEPAAPSTERP